MPTDLFTPQEFIDLRHTLHFPEILGYIEMPIHLGQAMHVNAKEARDLREAALDSDESEEDRLRCLEEAKRHEEDYQKVAAFSQRVHQRLTEKRGF